MRALAPHCAHTYGRACTHHAPALHFLHGRNPCIMMPNRTNRSCLTPLCLPRCSSVSVLQCFCFSAFAFGILTNSPPAIMFVSMRPQQMAPQMMPYGAQPMMMPQGMMPMQPAAWIPPQPIPGEYRPLQQVPDCGSGSASTSPRCVWHLMDPADIAVHCGTFCVGGRSAGIWPAGSVTLSGRCSLPILWLNHLLRPSDGADGSSGCMLCSAQARPSSHRSRA